MSHLELCCGASKDNNDQFQSTIVIKVFLHPFLFSFVEIKRVRVILFHFFYLLKNRSAIITFKIHTNAYLHSLIKIYVIKNKQFVFKNMVNMPSTLI